MRKFSPELCTLQEIWMSVINTILVDNNILLIVIFLSLFLLAYIKNIYPVYLHSVFKIPFSYQFFQRFYNDRSPQILRFSIITNLIFYVNIGFYGYLVFKYYHIDFLNFHSLLNIITISIAFFSFYILKYSVLKLFGYLISKKETINEYILNIFLYNKIIGIVLYPFLIIIPYIHLNFVDILIPISLAIILLLSVFKIFKGISILFKKEFSIFYMILYLCTFEILPLLILYKFIFINIIQWRFFYMVCKNVIFKDWILLNCRTKTLRHWK